MYLYVQTRDFPLKMEKKKRSKTKETVTTKDFHSRHKGQLSSRDVGFRLTSLPADATAGSERCLRIKEVLCLRGFFEEGIFLLKQKNTFLEMKY